MACRGGTQNALNQVGSAEEALGAYKRKKKKGGTSFGGQLKAFTITSGQAGTRETFDLSHRRDRGCPEAKGRHRQEAIVLDDHIRLVGHHDVSIKLHPEVTACSVEVMKQ